jgi:methyltransferase-like protein 6
MSKRYFSFWKAGKRVKITCRYISERQFHKKKIAYHGCDFDYIIWAKEAVELYRLPVVSMEIISNSTSRSDDEETLDMNTEKYQWNTFFRNHKSGSFFKPRNYLIAEFREYLSDTVDLKGLKILEVGCGYGCSMYPIIQDLLHLKEYIATDYSNEALKILKGNPSYNKSFIKTAIWDVTIPQLDLLTAFPDIVLCVFTLSAIKPENHIASLTNMASVLKNDGLILFRDYGLHDMTMYRHTIRYGEKLFLRNDNTLAYYFDLDYMREMARICDLKVLELEYATVEVKNRKSNQRMKRVFIHAVLQKNSVS